MTMLVDFFPQMQTWEDLTSVATLGAAFAEKFAGSSGRGIDRIDPGTFKINLAAECALLERKARGKTFRFSPFMERLVIKGREQFPRVLSVPTVRDRLLLHQLKEYLHQHIPDSVRRSLPNEYLRLLKNKLDGVATDKLSFIRADIKAFYDCIPHQALLDAIRPRLPDARVSELIRRAVTTPTVSKRYHRPKGGSPRNMRGVPQGLAISNALANVYLREIDAQMQACSLLYLRYVDDVLMIVPSVAVEASLAALELALDGKGLSLNQTKTYNGTLSEGFEYLGYRILWPTIGVRKTTVEAYLQSVAAMVTRYRYRVRDNKFPNYLSPNARRLAFLEELNERITGAVSGTRRYGWLFYFSEINDTRLLYGMDKMIAALLSQVDEFRASPPPELKRLVRASYEVRYSPDRGYIHNYNTLSGVLDRSAFLVRRGRLGSEDAARMTEDEINQVFDAYRREQLARLERDVGHIS